MGKPFEGELNAFPTTYDWALSAPITDLAVWVRSVNRLPLLAIGSGGSLTSAFFAALLHSRFTSRMAKAVTPLEFINTPVHLPEVATLFLTAGGGNPDILACVERFRADPAPLGVICTREGSPLARAVAEIGSASVNEYGLPTGKDGFLATNSLIASSVVLARAYAAAWEIDPQLPASLQQLVFPSDELEAFREELASRCHPLWDRDTTVVLHGHHTHAAAVDLESKFTEAALGHLHTADYRNFAHGRHHWLARHGATSGVIALVTPEDAALADRTLRLLPDEVHVVRVDLGQSSISAAISAIVVAMYIAGLAGAARGIDPGRPTVPSFGRRIYHLGGLRPPEPPASDLPDTEARAIERKARVNVVSLAARGELGTWRAAYAGFRTKLTDASFAAAIFDYDGTLCGAAERFNGPGAEVAKKLEELLEAGVLVGIATGRGKSVRKDLRKIFTRRSLWKRVLIGYHNAGEIGWLTDDAQPPETTELDERLRPVEVEFRADSILPTVTKIEAKLRQITLELAAERDSERVWEVVSRIARRFAQSGVSLVRSSHSIDALAPGVSKRLLVERVREELGRTDSRGEILCVGDKGSWPGNDYALLEEPYSLSVDEVSSDPATCWNLARQGERCVTATIGYLRAARIKAGAFTLRL